MARLARVGQTGRPDAGPEADCGNGIDAGRWLTSGLLPHSAAIEASTVAAGALPATTMLDDVAMDENVRTHDVSALGLALADGA